MSEKQTILVVDDDVDLFRKPLIKLLQLELADCVFLEADNGQEALSLIEEQHPILIILDLMMPVMNGIETLEQLANRGLLEKTKVVVLSAVTDHLAHAQVLHMGAFGYLEKATPLEELSSQIHALVMLKTNNETEVKSVPPEEPARPSTMDSAAPPLAEPVEDEPSSSPDHVSEKKQANSSKKPEPKPEPEPPSQRKEIEDAPPVTPPDKTPAAEQAPDLATEDRAAEEQRVLQDETPHPHPQFLPFQGQGESAARPRWSRKRFFTAIRKSKIAKVIFLFSIGVMSVLGIYYGSVDRNVSDGMIDEHISWIESHLADDVLQNGWKLKSVTQSMANQIDIKISITDPTLLRNIERTPRIARVSLLKYACPVPESDIQGILKEGWRLWVVLENSGNTLTGGTCHYPGVRN